MFYYFKINTSCWKGNKSLKIITTCLIVTKWNFTVYMQPLPSCPVQVVHPREMIRETREGCPPPCWLLKLGQMGTQRVQMKGVVRWSCRASTRYFCSALAGCFSRPSTKTIFLTVHYSDSFDPISQQPGQAAVLGRLSLSTCLWRCRLW
jgi:hypothetical protein